MNRRDLVGTTLLAGLAAGAGSVVTAQAQSASGEVWFVASNGNFGPKNLVNLGNIADRSAVVDVDAIYPGLVPPAAKSLILTVERGWLAMPTGGTGCASLRVMSHGYNLSNVLDRAKTQAWIVNNIGVDVIAEDVRMPIGPGRRTFFWALQSSHPAEAKKMVLIDLWGYVL